jgi:hypothetical protein
MMASHLSSRTLISVLDIFHPLPFVDTPSCPKRICATLL